MPMKREHIYLLNTHDGMLKTLPLEKISSLRKEYSELSALCSKSKDQKCKLRSDRHMQTEIESD
jgi:hypothetical protein